MNFNAANQTWRQFFGNGTTYVVPPFQRDYSWKQDQWDDLWMDIQEVSSAGGDPSHYMGYLVLQAQSLKSFTVIDGQQRLTTLSILALAVIKVLLEIADGGADADMNRRRAEQIRNNYIGFLDPVTLVARPKLTLNRTNNAFYQDKLVPLEKLPQRNLRSSEHLLRKAFEWFVKKAREIGGQDRNGETIAKFIDDLSDRLFFTVVTVTDELNAFRVFETLNSRGVRLSPTDLLKNHLFSVVASKIVHESDIEALERRWDRMVGMLGSEDFPNFLRVHWNSRNKLVREADLFKVIRDSTGDRAAVFELIRQMEGDVDLYTALPNPEGDFWAAGGAKSVRLLKMFNVRQPCPLLLAVGRSMASGEVNAGREQELINILRACTVISFRYNVICGLATNEQERTYNAVAQKVSNGELTSSAQIIHSLADIYVSDKQFVAAFEEKKFKTDSARNAQVIKYILFEIERQLSGRELDSASARYNIEHVLPQNPSHQWVGVSDADADDAADLIGNITLLEAPANRTIGNGDYPTKREAYSKSEFALTRHLADENESWTLENIRRRQRWLAEQAKGIWRLTQFDK